ncbi:dynamin-1-like [Oppia nitens]|uniref:dynamin-1-like n=1 Tax=Oppia nitens TaxID=1686743 RepID=UPI0023DA4793|nr:dynamin-1-like [Oppia nitens]
MTAITTTSTTMSGQNSGQNLIKIVNELQDKLHELGVNSLAIDLPQIAVIGGQSAGKSSVLEAFVGRDFLPRGSGIVTRRPLVLQLINDRVISQPYGVFTHLKDKRFHDFSEICREIVAETERECPESTGISAKPIGLKIHSPDVLDLTLVDLPGMTRVPIGKQPKDIESRIETMILEYIGKDNCLILAVTAANQDLATSDSLKLAERVDPRGERTIGILTKLDRMDAGTDARDILTGNYGINLKRGFIGVVNRSQQDIDARKSMTSALDDEQRYFRQHPAYRDLADRLGVRYLQQYLHKELAEHIYRLLPPLVKQFDEELSEIDQKLDAVSVQLVESDREMILAKTNEDYRRKFESAIGGLGWHIDVKRLSGGAKINVVMNETYGQDVDSVFSDETQIRRDITTAIQNYNGVYLGIFPPDAAFRACVLHQIELFRRPSLACVDSVALEITNIVKRSANLLETYPTIKEIYAKLSLDYIQECRKRCKSYVEHFLRTEMAYLNTNHEDFVKMASGINFSDYSTDSVSVKPPSTGVTPPPQITDRPIAASRVVNTGSSGGRGGGTGSLIANTMARNQKAAAIATTPKTSTWYDDNQPFTLLPEESDLISAGLQLPNNKQTILNNNTTTTADDNISLCSYDSIPLPGYMVTQVDQIKLLVESYISILKKKFKDHMPKLCTLELIDSAKQFIAIEMRIGVRDRIQSISDIVGNTDADDQLREELEKRQQHYREAIDILSRYRDNWCPTSSMASLSID